MFTFVLSSGMGGQGDFFSQMAESAAARRGRTSRDAARQRSMRGKSGRFSSSDSSPASTCWPSSSRPPRTLGNRIQSGLNQPRPGDGRPGDADRPDPIQYLQLGPGRPLCRPHVPEHVLPRPIAPRPGRGPEQKRPEEGRDGQPPWPPCVGCCGLDATMLANRRQGEIVLRRVAQQVGRHHRLPDLAAPGRPVRHPLGERGHRPRDRRRVARRVQGRERRPGHEGPAGAVPRPVRRGAVHRPRGRTAGADRPGGPGRVGGRGGTRTRTAVPAR